MNIERRGIGPTCSFGVITRAGGFDSRSSRPDGTTLTCEVPL